MGARVRDFKDLVVWQAAMLLAVEAYRYSARLPKDERFGLMVQMRRAAVSVPCNIAEGYGRQSLGDYQRFLRVANASLRELETQILLTLRLNMASGADAETLLGLCYRVHHLLSALMKKLRS